MNAGQIAGLIWDVCVWFFILSVVAAGIGFPRWRRRERVDAAETQRTLRLLKTDTTGEHIYDA